MRKDGKNANNESNEKGPSHDSHASHSSHDPDRLLPPCGDYQTLLSFQKAEIVYDITFRFAHKFLSKSDRTIDQMIQSARSGKKNLLEGSKPGGHQRKPNSSSLMWRAPVWKNCWMTTAIISALVTSRSGRRMPKKPY